MTSISPITKSTSRKKMMNGNTHSCTLPVSARFATGVVHGLHVLAHRGLRLTAGFTGGHCPLAKQ